VEIADADLPYMRVLIIQNAPAKCDARHVGPGRI
jgi:hypothetical protein